MLIHKLFTCPEQYTNYFLSILNHKLLTVYLVYNVYEMDINITVYEGSGDEKREEDSDDEKNIEEQEHTNVDGQQYEDEDHSLDEGASDSRFRNLFEHAEHVEATQPTLNYEVDSDSESEDKRPLGDSEYPNSPFDIDEEWKNFHKKDNKVRR